MDDYLNPYHWLTGELAPILEEEKECKCGTIHLVKDGTIEVFNSVKDGKMYMMGRFFCSVKCYMTNVIPRGVA